jgi:hypothetical protein
LDLDDRGLRIVAVASQRETHDESRIDMLQMLGVSGAATEEQFNVVAACDTPREVVVGYSSLNGTSGRRIVGIDENTVNRVRNRPLLCVLAI